MKTRIDQYGPGDLVPPEYKLLQATGGREAKSSGGKPGQFYHSLRGTAVDSITCSVVDILKVRTRWPAEILESYPECASDDADSGLSRDGRDCRECPFRCDTPWSVDPSERRTLCTTGFVLLGIDLEHEDEPFVFRAHGVSAGAMRELLSALRFNRKLKGEYWQAVVALSSMEKQTRQGLVFALQTRLVGIHELDRVEELRSWVNQLVGVAVTPALTPGEEVAELPEPTEVEEEIKAKTGGLTTPEAFPIIDF